MKRLFKKITALILAAAMCAGLMAVSVSAEGEDIATLTNDYIKVDVNKSNGGFHIDTVLGDKLEKDDDNKLLLHNSGDYDTSFTSLRITRDGTSRDYIFGRSYGFLGIESSAVRTTQEANRISSVWTVDGIQITQNIELANSASRENGMVIISYTARVLTGSEARVQVRVMLDTALGYQDYAYYSVPKTGGFTVIERETVLEGDEVYKDMMFGADDKLRPRVTAYTVNATVGDTVCVPYQVAFGHWNNLASTVFDFEPNPDLTFTNEYNVQYLTADSAYALYFDMGTLAPGADGTVATNYGVYANAGVADGTSLAINVAGADPMKLTEDRLHYVSSDAALGQDKLALTVMLDCFNGDSAEDLENVKVYVYSDDTIPALDEEGKPADSLTPYHFDYQTFEVNETKTETVTFNVEPLPNATYRKIEIVAYLAREDVEEVLDDDVIGRQTVYVLCPGTVEGVPDVVITGCTEHIYNQGKQRVSVSGTHFEMLKDPGQYTFKLARVADEGVYGEVYTVPESNVNVDAETNTVELLLPAATDEKGNVLARPLGLYQLIIDYVGEEKDDVISAAAKVIMTDDIRYSTMGYGIVAVVETEPAEEEEPGPDLGGDDKEEVLHRVEVFDNEEKFKAFEEELGDNEEILMVLKGDFSEERDYHELDGEAYGVYYQADVIVSNNAAQNPVTINDSLELRSGYIRVIHDYGDNKTKDSGGPDCAYDDQILVDVDGNMRIAGTGSLVYDGVGAFTAIENGTDYILRPYDENGERLTSELKEAEGDADDDSEDLNTITYIFSKAFDSFVSVANIVNVDFTFAELGVMYDTGDDKKDEEGSAGPTDPAESTPTTEPAGPEGEEEKEPTELTKLVSFGAAIDLSMLVPNGTRETDAGTNANAAGGQAGQQGGGQGGQQGSGNTGGGNTGSGNTGSGSTGSGSTGGDGGFVSEWRSFTTKLKQATTNARNLRANWAQYQAARRGQQNGQRPNAPTGSAPSTGGNPTGGVVANTGAGNTVTPGAATSGDSREIGKYPTGAAEVKDILYGGGKFIGLHFSVDVGVPPLTSAMPSIQGTLEVNTIGDWRFAVDGGLEFAKFSLQAKIEVIYNREKGIPVPNTLYLFLEVPPPGVNVDGFGIVWFRGGRRRDRQPLRGHLHALDTPLYEPAGDPVRVPDPASVHEGQSGGQPDGLQPYGGDRPAERDGHRGPPRFRRQPAVDPRL